MDSESQVIKGMKIYSGKPGSNYIIEKLFSGQGNTVSSQLSQGVILSQTASSLSRNPTPAKNQEKCKICQKAAAKWGIYGCDHLILCDSADCKADPTLRDDKFDDEDWCKCLICSRTGILVSAMSQTYF